MVGGVAGVDQADVGGEAVLGAGDFDVSRSRFCAVADIVRVVARAASRRKIVRLLMSFFLSKWPVLLDGTGRVVRSPFEFEWTA
jgi:hypothetical protein